MIERITHIEIQLSEIAIALKQIAITYIDPDQL